MTWKGWASIAAVVLAIGVGIWIVHLRQQNWLLKDADRVAEIDRFKSLAADAGRRADTFAAEATGYREESEQLQVEVDRLRKWRKTRKPPKTLEECKTQVRTFDAGLAIMERDLSLKHLSVVALTGALIEEERQSLAWKTAWELEQERSKGFQRIEKRERTKKVLIGVGSALGGGVLVGIAVGATQ